MRIKKSEIKTCKRAYLYADGHIVLVHEKRDRDAGAVNWVTIYENIGIKTYFEDQAGRLIIDKSVLPFLSVANRIDAKKADLRHGSDNTKSRNLPVETISFYNGTDFGWHISQFPSLISSNIYYQYETSEKFEDVKERYYWGDNNIKSVYAST